MSVQYSLWASRGIVTVYLENAVDTARSMGLPDSAAKGVDLDESDLITLLAAIRAAS